MAQTRKTYSCYIVRKNGEREDKYYRLPYNIVEITNAGSRVTYMELVAGGRFKSDQEREMVYDGVWFFDKDPYPPTADTSA